MINTVKYDFAQRIMIGQGTATRATMDTFAEVDEYLAKQSDIDRHFCKIYDREKSQLCDGFDYVASHYGRKINWRPW